MKDTTAILKEIYPHVELNIKKNLSKYKQCVSRFINTRSTILYSNILTTKPYFSEDDIVDFFKSTGIDRKLVNIGISHTYYYEIANFNPRYAKEDFVVAMICVIRYFKLKNMKKELELAMLHLAFSGKFYTSIFHRSFPVTDPADYVMQYVVTNMCTNKYDIVREGNVLGAVRSVCNTWIESYGQKFKDFHDDDCTYIIQQLHNRIGSFVTNLAELYYEAYEHKDVYITYDSDDISDDNYHLADSDSFRLERCVSAAMDTINNHDINYRICKMAANQDVKMDELKSILQTTFSHNEDMPLVRDLVTLIIANYYNNSKTKDVRDIDFITYTIKTKPNTKDPSLVKQKEILTKLLLKNSEKFKRRRNRPQTELAYYRACLAYFAILIQEANK